MLIKIYRSRDLLSPVPLHHVISAGALVYTLVWEWGRLLRNGWDVREWWEVPYR